MKLTEKKTRQEIYIGNYGKNILIVFMQSLCNISLSRCHELRLANQPLKADVAEITLPRRGF
jgi:hypothetical protein